MQSETLKKYPAELSLASLICLAGSMQSLAVALITAHHPSSWAVGWDSRLFTPLYTVSSRQKYILDRLIKMRLIKEKTLILLHKYAINGDHLN